jgi:hypothetical protein
MFYTYSKIQKWLFESENNICCLGLLNASNQMPPVSHSFYLLAIGLPGQDG